jgi:hypothetical protein
MPCSVSDAVAQQLRCAALNKLMLGSRPCTGYLLDRTMFQQLTVTNDYPAADVALRFELG